jgi:hypothetical protein
MFVFKGGQSYNIDEAADIMVSSRYLFKASGLSRIEGARMIASL